MPGPQELSRREAAAVLGVRPETLRLTPLYDRVLGPRLECDARGLRRWYQRDRVEALAAERARHRAELHRISAMGASVSLYQHIVGLVR